MRKNNPAVLCLIMFDFLFMQSVSRNRNLSFAIANSLTYFLTIVHFEHALTVIRSTKNEQT